MSHARQPRTFGRTYVIQWDDEVRRYHVSLGSGSVGFHKDQEGAAALAESHARHVTVAGGTRARFVMAGIDGARGTERA